MKFLDERGRIFGKINLFDLLAVLVLILGVLFIALRPSGADVEELEDYQVPAYHHATYVFEITGLRDYMLDSLQEGDALYKEGTKIGEIVKIEAEKQKVDTLQEDGSYKAVERILHYNVKVTMETDRFYEDDGRFISGMSMLNGTTQSLTNGLLSFESVVRSVTIGDPLPEEELKEIEVVEKAALKEALIAEKETNKKEGEKKE